MAVNYADKDIIINNFTDLIDFYAGKSAVEDMKSDLMLFLLELISANRAISRRYVAVAVRNQFIRISKAELARRNTEVPYNGEICGQIYYTENIIDMKNALSKLPDKQRKTLILHRVNGLSFEELAKKHGTTRQAQYRLEKRAAINARRLLSGEKTSERKSASTESPYGTKAKYNTVLYDI